MLEVRTTLLTLASNAALRTFNVPSTAGLINSFSTSFGVSDGYGEAKCKTILTPFKAAFQVSGLSKSADTNSIGYLFSFPAFNIAEFFFWLVASLNIYILINV